MNLQWTRVSVLSLALGLAACQPPEPPLLAPSAAAAARPGSTPDVDGTDRAPRTAPADTPAAVGADSAGAPAVASVALDHAGDVLIGQHITDLEPIGPWTAQGAVEAMGGTCEYYDGQGLPAGMSMMTEEDRVVRFDLGPGGDPAAPVDQPGPFDVRIGMSREQAMARFPTPPDSSPHPYNGAQGEFLTWQDPGSDLGMRLDLFEGKVTQIYWGTSDAIEFNEGCA